MERDDVGTGTTEIARLLHGCDRAIGHPLLHEDQSGQCLRKAEIGVQCESILELQQRVVQSARELQDTATDPPCVR